MNLQVAAGHLHINIVQKSGQAPAIGIFSQSYGKGSHHCLGGQAMHNGFFILYMLPQPRKSPIAIRTVIC